MAMKLTPQALRLVSGLMSSSPDGGAHSRWLAWAARTPGGDLPDDLLLVVIEALTDAAWRLEQALSAPGIDDDRESDLVNELGYIQAISGDLKKEATILHGASAK